MKIPIPKNILIASCVTSQLLLTFASTALADGYGRNYGQTPTAAPTTVTTPSYGQTPTYQQTPTPTSAPWQTPSYGMTPTVTPVATATIYYTNTPGFNVTPAATGTPVATGTAVQTQTPSSTVIPSTTVTPGATPTSSYMPGGCDNGNPTPTPTPVGTCDNSNRNSTGTPTPTPTPTTSATPTNCGVQASDTTLWPPNHKFRKIIFLDENGNEVSPNITRVYQDQAPSSIGNTKLCPDARIDLNGDLNLRSERSTKGNDAEGRTYHIQFTTGTGDDQCSGQVNVCVPADNDPDSQCSDKGEQYNSLTCDKVKSDDTHHKNGKNK